MLTTAAGRKQAETPARTVPERVEVLTIDGSQIRYRLRISARAARVRLEISGDSGLLVVVPKRYRLADLPELLRSRWGWIRSKLELVERRRVASPATTRDGLEDGAPVLYRGGHLTLSVVTRQSGRPEVTVQGGRLQIAVSARSSVKLESVLEAWYRREADRVIRQRVDELAEKLGVTYAKVFVKNQRSRWGSCSTRRNINFNWRLILMPDDVMDYIVSHELTHLEVPNHSPRFWSLVAARCPAYRQYKLWLRRNGATLMLH